MSNLEDLTKLEVKFRREGFMRVADLFEKNRHVNILKFLLNPPTKKLYVELRIIDKAQYDSNLKPGHSYIVYRKIY